MIIHLKQRKLIKKITHRIGNLNKGDLNQSPYVNDNAIVHSEELHSCSTNYTRYRETLLNITH